MNAISALRSRSYRPSLRTGAGTSRPRRGLAQSGSRWRPGDSGFDYQAAFGRNPWAEPARRISNLLGGAGGGFHRGGFRSGSSKTHVARPSDAAVQDYMSHVLSGQRNMLDEYVRRAAGAGIKRAGLNVRGGPSAHSALHHSAMKRLASGYADRFREAMNYNKYLKSTAYSQQADRLRNLQNLMGLQHRYLSSEAAWRNRLGSLMHSDWQDATNWKRQQPFRQIELQRASRQARREHWQDRMERAQRRRGLEQGRSLDSRWNRLMSNKTRRWTPQFQHELERLMVDTGVWQPLSRSRSHSFSL